MILDHLPVCAAGMEENAIGALCREEGFSHGVSSSGDVVGTCRSLVCSSGNLLNCELSLGVNQEAAIVECDGDVGVQLLGGMQANRGHIIYLNGLLCDDNWNLSAANVVCRELGFSGAANFTTHSYFGPVETPLMVAQGVTVPYSIKNVLCVGTEEKLSECGLTTAVASDCEFGEAAGVICRTESTDGGRQRRKREAKKRIAPAAILAGLQMGAAGIGAVSQGVNALAGLQTGATGAGAVSQGANPLTALQTGAAGAGAVSQGVNAIAETAASLNSAKESLTQLFDRGPAADSGGDQMLASALSYFEKIQQQREQEQKEMLNNNQNSVNLGPIGIEVKMKHDKGYLDLGGEFQDGGSDIKIQEISRGGQEKQSGGNAYSYPAGIGPMLINGCFGQDYKKGDPCYTAKIMNTKCLNMIEAANFIGVGFDGVGDYTHANRRKSLIQRVCANKGTYQGEDVPDTMNVFGVYDTDCNSRTHDSMAARSEYLREKSNAGNNKNFLTGSSGTKASAYTVGGEANSWYEDESLSVGINRQSTEDDRSSTDSKDMEGRGSEELTRSKEVTRIFEFVCRIRRYELFLDEVTPEQLSEAFLLDYMNLPVRFHDFRNRAPQKYMRFLERWGTHYIKSASFGGKFSLIRASTKSGSETTKEWEAKMLTSVKDTMSSSSSRSERDAWERKASQGVLIKDEQQSSENSADGQTSGQSNGTSGEKSQTNGTSSADRSEISLTKDEIIVEGGHQHVASILSDLSRSGFKAEFKDWLDSIPQYPKGYDFHFGDLAELLDINFATMVSEMGSIQPCWENNVTNGYYEAQIKDENGDFISERRRCSFLSTEDFVVQMNKRRLSLKRAIAVYAENRGKTGNDMTLPAGPSKCEGKRTHEMKNIDFATLSNGKNYLVTFQLSAPVGNKISPNDRFLLSFKTSGEPGKGRWVVSIGGKTRAGQIGKEVTLSDTTKSVTIKDVDFTLVSSDFATTLEWSQADCGRNVKRFNNLQNMGVSCADDDANSVDWLKIPLAIVESLETPTTFVPCNVRWSNLHMLVDDDSCVRFTAASSGPIYFVLSAIPAKFDTWYYFRITYVSNYIRG